MTKKEAIHFLYQIADEIQSFLDKTSSPKGNGLLTNASKH